MSRRWIRLWALILKELRQIRHNRRLIISLLIPPTLQIVIFGFALNPTVDRLRLGVVDESRTQVSRDLTSAFVENHAFVVTTRPESPEALAVALDRGSLDGGLVIPADYARRLDQPAGAHVQLLFNAINANTGTIAQAYAEEILAAYNAAWPARITSVAALPSAMGTNEAEPNSPYSTVPLTDTAPGLNLGLPALRLPPVPPPPLPPPSPPPSTPTPTPTPLPLYPLGPTQSAVGLPAATPWPTPTPLPGPPPASVPLPPQATAPAGESPPAATPPATAALASPPPLLRPTPAPSPGATIDSGPPAHAGPAQPVSVRVALLYNPGLISAWFIVTGTFGVLLTLNGSLVAAATTIKEKDTGTLEQLLMTPAETSDIIIAKMSPLFLLLLMDVFLVLIVTHTVFDVPIRGSLCLMVLAGGLCSLVGISIGTLIGTVAQTTLQAQLISFFVNPPLAMLSGSTTPVEAMPAWLQPLTWLNPIRHFSIIARGILIKGVGLDALYPNFLALLAFALVLVTVSVRRYRRQLG